MRFPLPIKCLGRALAVRLFRLGHSSRLSLVSFLLPPTHRLLPCPMGGTPLEAMEEAMGEPEEVIPVRDRILKGGGCQRSQTNYQGQGQQQQQP